MSHDLKPHVLSFMLYTITRCCVISRIGKGLSPGSDNKGLRKPFGILPKSDDHRGVKSRDVASEVETTISDGRLKV